ncbi:MAG TPA: PqqD family protein [Bacteroidia bacterium]|jgi:hypothetical protein|nr:PqqD family protein [Bacteroidia bacterium]
MKLKDTLVINNSGLVLDTKTGNSFTTNPIGIEIIRMLMDGKSAFEIKTQIMLLYRMDEELFENDFDNLVDVLIKHKLIEQFVEKK